MQTLHDFAFQIPVLMEKFDSACCLPSELFSDQIFSSLRDDALKIQSSMRNWETCLRGDDETSQLYIPRLASRKPPGVTASDLGEIFPISYDFPSFNLAAALTYYEMFQISVYCLLIDMELHSRDARCIRADGPTIDTPSIDIRDLTTKSIECADRTCQSIEYFFDGSKRMTRRMVIMGPFNVARVLFARLIQTGTGDTQRDTALLQRMRFCNVVAQHFQAEGLPVWDGT